MATHEIYVGGPATANFSRSMYPAPAFNPAAAWALALTPAAHKGNTGYALTRVIDTEQHAMAEFLREHTLAQGDVLGSILIPPNVVFKGLFYHVQRPTGAADALTITPSLRSVTGGTFPVIAGQTADGRGFAKAGSAAWFDGNESIADGTDFFIATPTILDLTLTAYDTDTKLGALRLMLSPLVETMDHGQY